MDGSGKVLFCCDVKAQGKVLTTLSQRMSLFMLRKVESDFARNVPRSPYLWPGLLELLLLPVPLSHLTAAFAVILRETWPN